jgi:hypothetical protein
MRYLLVLFFVNLSSYASDNRIFDSDRDSNWLPVTYIVNGTYDVIQNPYWFSQRNLGEKYEETWRRVRSPHSSIKKDGGYSKFFKDEFFSPRVLPNIGLHFVGGAYDTLWLTEYFRHHNVMAPQFFALLTTYAARFGNEALETTSNEINSHDHIADLYIFDLAAFFAARSPTIMNFLLDDLSMKAWHFNPMFDVDGKNFFNAGLNYIFRPETLHFTQGKNRPLLYLGMQNMVGLSHQYKTRQTISMAMGMSLTNPLKQKGRFVTGLFHETGGELDASLFINGSEDYRWRLNLYENIIRQYFDRPWRLSLMMGQAKGPAYALGIMFHMPFGIAGILNENIYQALNLKK